MIGRHEFAVDGRHWHSAVRLEGPPGDIGIMSDRDGGGAASRADTARRRAPAVGTAGTTITTRFENTKAEFVHASGRSSPGARGLSNSEKWQSGNRKTDGTAR
jgi:hypothetical protein